MGIEDIKKNLYTTLLKHRQAFSERYQAIGDVIKTWNGTFDELFAGVGEKAADNAPAPSSPEEPEEPAPEEPQAPAPAPEEPEEPAAAEKAEEPASEHPEE